MLSEAATPSPRPFFFPSLFAQILAVNQAGRGCSLGSLPGPPPSHDYFLTVTVLWGRAPDCRLPEARQRIPQSRQRARKRASVAGTPPLPGGRQRPAGKSLGTCGRPSEHSGAGGPEVKRQRLGKAPAAPRAPLLPTPSSHVLARSPPPGRVSGRPGWVARGPRRPREQSRPA